MTRRVDLDPARGMAWGSLLGIALWVVVAAIVGAIYR